MAQPVQLRGSSLSCFFDFTRPSNTTAYAAGDNVNTTETATAVTPFKFPATRMENGSGYVVGGRMIKSTTTTTAASFRLWLFVREPFAAAGYPADNAALSFAFGDAGLKSCIGFLDFDAGNWITGTNSAYCDNSSEKSLAFSLEDVGSMPSSDSVSMGGMTFDRTKLIYGLLEARGTYSPGSGEQFRISLDISPLPASSRSGAAGDEVIGNVASGATDSGNPVKVGGRHNTTQPTLTDGQRGDLQLDTRGNLKTALLSGNGTTFATVVAVGGDAVSWTGSAILGVGAQNLLFNGSNVDRARNNTDITVLASAARTATNQSADQTNYNGRGLHLVINVTAASATPSVVFTIQGKCALSSAYYTILASVAITGTGTTVLRVFPGATAAANLAANDIIPRTWRVDATHADADSITYSVSASVIL